MRLRPTWAEIDLTAIHSNFLTLKNLLPEDSFICPMIKANAYGHGAVEVSKQLEKSGAKFLGVSLVEEGIELRKAGASVSILVFGSFFDLNSASACIEFSLTPVIGSFEQLEILERVSSGKNLKVHLKFNTGMNRLGFSRDQASVVRERVKKIGSWTIEGICTHLSCGEDTETRNHQFQVFESVLSEFQGMKFFAHALNSSGLGALDLAKLKVPYGARPGISLYGPQPISFQTKLALRNVMTLKSTIVASRWVPAGQSVSYNSTWTAQRDSLIGILPMGYADGIKRNLSNKFSVLCRGSRVPVVGTVCMDYVMLDLTAIKDQLSQGLGVGEEVVLIGRQGAEEITALEWAQILGTITYEIFTSISSRVPRVYVST